MKKLTTVQKLRLAMVWGDGERCQRCAKPATCAAAFDSWTGTYRTRSTEFFRNTNTEIQPKLFCNTCAELPITACGVCGGLEAVGKVTMVSRKSENPGYETLWDLMCKVDCGDMRRSVALDAAADGGRHRIWC